MFVISPCSWVRAIKLAGGVHKETEVGAVPHQVGVADVVLDQATAQDDHALVGSKINWINAACFFKIMQQRILRILPVFTLLIASLLISLKSSRMSTTNPNEYDFIFWGNFWSRKCLDFWRSGRRACLPGFRPSEREKPLECRSLKIEIQWSFLKGNSLCRPVVYWRLVVDLETQPVARFLY